MGVWIETGPTTLDAAKNQEIQIEPVNRKLSLAEKSLRAAFKVVPMRAQYLRNMMEHGLEMARQMSVLVEQRNDAVFSESYRSARRAPKSKIEIEAAKCSPEPGLSVFLVGVQRIRLKKNDQHRDRASGGGGRGTSVVADDGTGRFADTHWCKRALSRSRQVRDSGFTGAPLRGWLCAEFHRPIERPLGFWITGFGGRLSDRDT